MAPEHAPSADFPNRKGNVTLYDRIGGEATVYRLVSDFYNRVLSDPLLAPVFEGADVDRLLTMQQVFFTAALGGPVEYEGRSMAHAHHGLKITRRHFARFVECLFDTLRDFGLSERETREVVARINTYADEVVGGHGSSG